MAGVYIFNAMGVPINIIFNAGTPTLVNGTSGTALWVPISPGTEPVFVNNTAPTAGQIGLGNNSMTVYPTSLQPTLAQMVTVKIPTTIQIDSLQFYIFWASASSVSWILLQQGQPIAGSLNLPII